MSKLTIQSKMLVLVMAALFYVVHGQPDYLYQGGTLSANYYAQDQYVVRYILGFQQATNLTCGDSVMQDIQCFNNADCSGSNVSCNVVMEKPGVCTQEPSPVYDVMVKQGYIVLDTSAFTTNQFCLKYTKCCWAINHVPAFPIFFPEWFPKGETKLQTVVRTGVRDDTNKPNQSPVVNQRIIIRYHLGCTTTMHLPMFDPDGDNVQCDFTPEDEVGFKPADHASSTHYLSTQNNICQLAFDGVSFFASGAYEMALTLTDSKTSDITIDGQVISAGTPFSKVSLQFELEAIQVETIACNAPIPAITVPTASDQNKFELATGETFNFTFVTELAADAQLSVNNLLIIGPPGITEVIVNSSASLMEKTFSWTPADCNKGWNGICGQGVDNFGRTGDAVCIYIEVYGNPCSDGYCLNNGTCIDINRTAVCMCALGYEGDRCETKIPCVPDPCEFGNCTTMEFNATVDTCVCKGGYAGPTCNIDLCTLKDCNNGTCFWNDVTKQTECECFGGYTGEVCDILLCDSVNCNNGTCQWNDTLQDTECVCDGGYEGTFCEDLKCDSVNCNTGDCEWNQAIENTECICPGRFEGDFCEIDKCDALNCTSQGTCEWTGQAVECICANGFSGTLCEIDPCENETCSDNGTCFWNETSNNIACDCDSGYIGDQCESHVCDTQDCNNHGTCLVDPGTNQPKCDCDLGYVGDYCDVRLCDSLNCQNGGECMLDGAGNPFCDCPANYTGDFCQFGFCDNNDCLNGGTCDQNQERCNCPPGFTGQFCEVDECEDVVCLHGGTCIDGKCECPMPWTGPNCDTEVCDPPCETGVCRNGVCGCPPGYSGEACDEKCDACDVKDRLAGKSSMADELDDKLEDMREEFEEFKRSQGPIYTRWGAENCPVNSALLYLGYTASSSDEEHGGSSAPLCIPTDMTLIEYEKLLSQEGLKFPHKRDTYRGFGQGNLVDILRANKAKFKSRDKEVCYASAKLFGVGYECQTSPSDGGVPCAVCKAQHSTCALMMPGTYECAEGWTELYDGFLASGADTSKSNFDFVCVDMACVMSQIPCTGASCEDRFGQVLHRVSPARGHFGTSDDEDFNIPCIVCSK